MKQESSKKDDSILEAINSLAMATGKGFDDMRKNFNSILRLLRSSASRVASGYQRKSAVVAEQQQ